MHVGGRNQDFDWDSFDPVAYNQINYRPLRDEDRQIIATIRDFFIGARVRDAYGLDIGSGSNLYPALAMLPFCRRLDLCEFSAANVRWLQRETRQYHPHWDEFWDIYGARPEYAGVVDPRRAFADSAAVRRGSIFDLRENEWTMGTMFFVACSISTEMVEFNTAVHRFVRALRPGAPFAAAFMLESKGYYVNDGWFPAVCIGADDVEQSLAPFAYDVTIKPIDSDKPLRDGYNGMLVVTGRADWRR